MNNYKTLPMYRYLMVLTICSTAGLQGWRTLFDNFAVNSVGLEGAHIGVLQSVREIPGLLALLAVYIMMVIKEHRLSAFSVLTLGIGVAVTGFFPSFGGLIFTTLIFSFGFHYYETTNKSLTLQYFDRETSPLVFGRLRSHASATNIAVGLIIFVMASFLGLVEMYIIMGGAIAAGAIWGLSQDPADKEITPQQRKMVFRKKYWLFYTLTLLAGARRQIFVAFAVFLLVKKFGYTVRHVTVLFVINNVINYFLSPYIGKLVVKYGERKVLSLEYSSLVFIFIAYAVVDSKVVVGGLYILDHIFFNFALAINTFFQKIGDPADTAPTMAVGFTINHIAAVVLPAIGGLLWMVDYRIPFIGGAVLSLVSLLFVQLIDSQLKLRAVREN
jgi:hypothetical protein